MKITNVLSLLSLGIALSSMGTTVHAQTAYSATLTNSTSNWDTSGIWSPDATPGSGDTVTDISGSSTFNLYLNGSREIANLGKTSSGNIRLYGGTTGSGGDSSFTITDTIEIKQGTYHIRSSSFGGNLTVETQDLVVGDAVGNAGLTIGNSSAAGESNVTFTVLGTTTVTGSASVISVAGNSNLNHLLFEDATTSTGSTYGVNIASGVELEVKSVRSEGTIGTNVAFRGAGTLLITGDLDDPLQPPGTNNTKTQFTGDIAVRKTGNNTQIFSRERASNYTGGTEISGGILAISNSRTTESALGSGSVVVEDGGTLASAGFGTVAVGNGQSVTVKSGGSIAPGALNDGFATLAFNGTNNGNGPVLTMESGAEFTFRLGSEDQSDLIAMVGYSGPGDLVLNNTAVNITGTIQEGLYTLFTFKSNAASNNNLGDLSTVASGLTGGLVIGSGFEGFTGTFYYDDPLHGGLGTISLELTAVPEPGVTALMGLALTGFALAVRRRKRSLPGVAA